MTPVPATIKAILRVPAVWITAGLVVAYFGYVIAIYGEPFPRAEDYLEIAKRQTPQAFATEAMSFLDYVRYFLYQNARPLLGRSIHMSTTTTRPSPWSFWTIAYAATLGVVGAAATAEIHPLGGSVDSAVAGDIHRRHVGKAYLTTATTFIWAACSSATTCLC